MTPAGQICGSVNKMKSVGQVVEGIVDEAIRILEEDFPARVRLDK